MVLPVKERAFVESSQIDLLRAQLGASVAEGVICRALEELGHRLGRVERFLETNDMTDLHRTVRSVAAIAAQIGLAGLVQVAGDVQQCQEDGDHTALHATTARLIRVGEQSLTAIWDTHDQLI